MQTSIPPIMLLVIYAVVTVVVAHEEKVPIWTQLVESSNQSHNTKSSSYPGPRSKSATWLDNDTAIVWMFGGITSKVGHATGCPTVKVCPDGVVLNELWQYNISADKWSLDHYDNSSVLPEPRHSAVICGQSGNFIALFGGYNKQNETLHDTWIFDLQKRIWKKEIYSGVGECSTQPGSRALMLHWCMADSLWILGGLGSGDENLSDMWKFSFSDKCWSLQSAAMDSLSKQKKCNSSSFAPQPDSPSWVLRDTDLVFLSNISEHDGQQPFNQTCELWTMSTKNLHWRPFRLKTELMKTSASHKYKYVKFEGDSPACRESAASWVDGADNLWLYGGHRHIPRFINKTSVYACDQWVLETTNNTWIKWYQNIRTKVRKYFFKTVPPHVNIPTPRAHAMTWSYNGTAYLFGGESQIEDNVNVRYLNDFWRWYMGHPDEASHQLLVPPSGVFFITLGALCFLAICVFGTIFVAKASSPQAPRLKPPTHNGKIKYSPVSTSDDLLFD